PEIDAALQAQVGEIVRAEHARSGDPAEKRPARVGVGLQRLLRRERHQVLDEGLGEVVLRFAGEMDVRVDQAGKQGRVAEIDHLRVRRHLHAASDGDDPVAFDDHGGALDQRTSQVSCSGLVLPCSSTPASLPKAMRTPTFCAFRIISGQALPDASIFSTMAGGNFFPMSGDGPAGSWIGPGTRKTFFLCISASVSALRKVPCSMESTPALIARFAAASPW